MLRTLIVVAAAGILLVACGGGGSAPGRPMVVDLVGNSIAFGLAPHVQRELDARQGPGVVVVRNKGKGGTKIFDLVAGTMGFDAWPIGMDADLTLHLWGTNEAARAHRDPLPDFAAALRTIARANTAFITPPPMDLTVTDPRIGTAEVESYAQVVRDVAGALGVDVLDVHAYVTAIPAWETLLRDGLHPGEELLGRIARDVIVPYVEAQ